MAVFPLDRLYDQLLLEPDLPRSYGEGDHGYNL
jgi:hypothetical protein